MLTLIVCMHFVRIIFVAVFDYEDIFTTKIYGMHVHDITLLHVGVSVLFIYLRALHCIYLYRERDLFLPEIGLQHQNLVENGSNISRSVSQPWVFVEDIEDVISAQNHYLHAHICSSQVLLCVS